jgi:hypothetical protein
MRKLFCLIAALAALAGGAAYLGPRAADALALRLAADEPERLADLRLEQVLDRATIAREIDGALATGDIELAESFVALAQSRGIEIPAELTQKMEAAGSVKEHVRRFALRFGRGFVTGEVDGAEGLAGAATGDLLVYGDVRDLARESWRGLRGESVDPLIVGLASVGLAVTAATYFSSGASAPARTGISLFKAARRTGKVSVGLAADVGRLVRTGGGARAINGLADLGRIEGKAGARAALEAMRHADDVADLSRLTRLAEKNGRTTLAILKTLGRGAIALGAGALTGALWVMGAAVNVFLFVLALCTIFASAVRALWRTGRFAWRYGHYAGEKIAAATQPA